MSQDFNPSYAKVEEAIIESYDGNARVDLKGIVYKLEFTQSINSPVWSGSISCLDASGMLENESFKIRGEEKLTLSIQTYDLKLKDPIVLEAQVISVVDVKPTENLTGLSFTLNFISKISYESGLKRVRDSYPDQKASEIAEKVFKKYFGSLSETTKPKKVKQELIPFEGKKYEISGTNGLRFYLQPTEGTMRSIIPNLLPSQTMNFLTHRSFSKNSPSCSFRFFETFDGFFYVTDEFLIQRGVFNPQNIEVFSYNAQNSMEPDKVEMQTNTFETFSAPVRVDTANDVRQGGYRSKVFEVDLGRRRVKTINYDYIKDAKYIDMSGEKTSIKDSIHTKEYIEETFTEDNAKRYLIFKDYYDESGFALRANLHYPEIVQNRNAYQHHLGQTVVTASLKGRMDVRPGDIIAVKVPKFTIEQQPDKPYNEQLSGNYMIVATQTMIQDDLARTTFTLAKYDWSGDYEE